MSKFLKNTRIKRNALEYLVTLHFKSPMNKHLLLLVTAILVINAELDNVLLPRAFLRWNLRNEYQKPIIFFEKQEIDGKQLNAISVPVREDSGLSEIKRILKQMLADIDKIKKNVDRSHTQHKTKMSRRTRKQ